jgi:integrase
VIGVPSVDHWRLFSNLVGQPVLETLFEGQNVLGHASPAMTQRYAHLQPDHLRKAIRALEKKLISSKPRSRSKKASE